METKKDDGGQAFPMPIGYAPKFGGGQFNSQKHGMSLWDYFAAHALSCLEPGASDYSTGACNGEFAARAAFIADAMIAERNKRFGGTNA